MRCFPTRDLDGTSMHDEALFMRAKREADILITKDVDIVHLLRRHGPPPKVIWLRMGNTSNARLKEWFTHRWRDVLAFAESSEPLVEVAE